jgi:hypothetical protein
VADVGERDLDEPWHLSWLDSECAELRRNADRRLQLAQPFDQVRNSGHSRELGHLRFRGRRLKRIT